MAQDTTTPNTTEQNIARYGPNCLPSIGEYSSIFQDERIAQGYTTIANLIHDLSAANPQAAVITDDGVTLSSPHSNRGFYVDLSLTPSAKPQTVSDLIDLLALTIGTEYQAWKGGGMFRMNADTPVWVAHHGESGKRITGITITDTLVTIHTSRD